MRTIVFKNGKEVMIDQWVFDEFIKMVSQPQFNDQQWTTFIDNKSGKAVLSLRLSDVSYLK